MKNKTAYRTIFLINVVASLLLCMGCSKPMEQKKGDPEKKETAAETGPPKPTILRCTSLIREAPGNRWKKKVIENEMALFDFANPSVKLITEWESTQSIQAMIERTISNIQSNQYSVDVIPMTKRIYNGVAKGLHDPNWGKKYLVDFSTKADFIKAHKPSIFQVNNFEINTGSILTGPFLEGHYYSTWYNSELGEKVGLNISGNTISFEELLTNIERINAYNENAAERVYAISSERRDYCTRIIFFNLLLSAMVDEEGNLPKTIKPSKQKLTVLYTLEQLKRLADLDPFVPIKNFLSTKHNPSKIIEARNNIRLQLLNNKAVFFISDMIEPEHYDLYPIAQINNALRLLELPSLKPINYAPAYFASSWAVFKNSPNVDVAIKLMEHWTRPEVAETWTQASQNITCLNRTLYTASLEDDIFGQFIARQERKYGNNIIDLTSAVHARFTSFDFPFSKTMELIKQLQQPKASCEAVMQQLLKK